MAQTTLPTWHDHGTTYVADRCNHLVQAVAAGRVKLRTLARAGYPGETLAKGQLPGVLSVGYWDAKGRQDWGLATHCNEGIEITCLETGQTPFRAAGRDYLLKPGSLTVTRPWQPHSLGDPYIGSGRLHWIILDVGMHRPHQRWQWPEWFVLTPSDLTRLTQQLRQNETVVWQANAEIRSCFQAMAEIIEKKESPLRFSRLTLLINQLFLALYALLQSQQLPLQPELTTSLRSVELFLASLQGNPEVLAQPWTAQAMAQQCAVGLTRFTHLCKTVTNMTPIQYLNTQRVEAAIILMQQRQRTITDIALTCGFGSSQYFATVFKQIKGCSPTQWRQGYNS